MPVACIATKSDTSCPLGVKRFTSTRAMRAKCPLCSESDRIDASQQSVAKCQKRHSALQQIFLLNQLVATGDQHRRQLQDRERRPSAQPFSSRLSWLKKRQSVPCAMILLGVDLIMPASYNRNA